MTWKVVLGGHEFDLGRLERELSGPHRVNLDDEGEFVLSSTEFDGLSDATDVKSRADAIVRRINGSYRLSGQSYDPVQATGSLKDGGRRHAVVIADTVTVRVSVGDVHVLADGTVKAPPQSAASRRVGRAASDPAVSEALEVIGDADVDWPRLYKVYEIVKDDVGGQSDVDSLPGVSSAERSAFSASANRPDVSGDGARHARMGGDRPKQTMTLAEGRDFIGRLVDAWISTKP